MISKNVAKHYKWGNDCDGWLLVNVEDQSIIHEKMPPNTYETRHYHKVARQFFFVLEGEMEIEMDGMKTILQKHEGIEVMPMVPHQVFNKTSSNLEFLVISKPSTRLDRNEV